MTPLVLGDLTDDEEIHDLSLSDDEDITDLYYNGERSKDCKGTAAEAKFSNHYERFHKGLAI